MVMLTTELVNPGYELGYMILHLSEDFSTSHTVNAYCHVITSPLAPGLKKGLTVWS